MKVFRVEPGNTVSLMSVSDKNFAASEPATVKIKSKPSFQTEKGILHSFEQGGEARLDKFIEAYRAYYGVPGLSLGLIRDGKLFFSKTYGYKNAFTKELVDSGTYFEAASITKPVFAYVVLRLAERNVIDLDKPLAEYLPFEDLEEFPEYKLMTGRHVLIHLPLPVADVLVFSVPQSIYPARDCR